MNLVRRCPSVQFVNLVGVSFACRNRQVVLLKRVTRKHSLGTCLFMGHFSCLKSEWTPGTQSISVPAGFLLLQDCFPRSALADSASDFPVVRSILKQVPENAEPAATRTSSRQSTKWQF